MTKLATILRLTWGCLLMFSFLKSYADDESTLDSDETILFFPALATWNVNAQAWDAQIHGIVFEASSSTSRAVKIPPLRRLLGLKNLSEAEETLANARLDAFTVDHERGERIVLRLQETDRRLPGESEANGHLRAQIRLSLPAEHRADLPFSVILAKDDKRVLGGVIRFAGPTGFSVISDIDDTVKISEVLDKEKLLRNTFCLPFQPVPGMAERYRGWNADGNLCVHFVTGSPWQLYGPLQVFLADNQFPVHALHMRHARLTDSSIWDFLGSPQEFKLEQIEAILLRHPQRKFVLVGDSGEQDPLIYACIARAHPDRIHRIFIRAVREGETGKDFEAIFHDIPREHWQVFREAAELPAVLEP